MVLYSAGLQSRFGDKVLKVRVRFRFLYSAVAKGYTVIPFRIALPLLGRVAWNWSGMFGSIQCSTRRGSRNAPTFSGTDYLELVRDNVCSSE